MRNESIRYLIVPGWQGSPDNHWQSHWQRTLPNSARVEQLDWLTPQRRDWVQALEQAITAERSPVILIAHSLGCITVAHWAAEASPALLRQVRGALLVAPADVERPTCAPALRNFAPIPMQALPFPSQVVSSDNDPAVSVPRALHLAQAWGAEAGLLTNAGHINVKSGHERWEQGFAYLYRLQSRVEQRALRRA
ncbi:alpha/beta hydrolase [Pseudomonas sp. P1B16]|jgi:predicted alpha/beta hydrolase family esterase|uniref:alpha/beta hydrolase n=1 Tax=Pseudomonas TaxID=286 RepID=UPI0005148672|nr:MULTISPECIES: alpha/beta hydrolase [unclassified Pseudomonas]KGI94257.1 alpha/beta hydrolase [Pseudomonas sp. H2]MDD2061608.1 alpha/beta hydrolase [Pseudomonas sp. 25571]MDD2127907.1 alpha/beta hydrolase [Pseudomonas sp. 17391]UDU81120.1 alpha/beta hydrolase [Pseudomonas sp. HN2-3]UPL06221.1 putative esterase of the alpha/beta hydrolase fold protein [Pseudomonas sp. IsoF]